jgi:UDP-N-acetyl-D-mannosaminuronate dehydrogenase
VQTTQWTSCDPFSSQKAETFKQSGKAIYRARHFQVNFHHPSYIVAEIATTMHELEEERAKLQSDSEKLGVLFKEMIQMCLWLIVVYFPFRRALMLPI